MAACGQQRQKPRQPRMRRYLAPGIGLRVAAVELKGFLVHNRLVSERLLAVGQAQHQPHVLYRRTRGAFAKIVEASDQNRLTVFVAGKDI